MESQNQEQNCNQVQNEDKQDKKAKNNNKKEEVVVNSIKADGGAYKGKPKNDYCLHFVETGERPQNFIRDYEEEKRFLDYPKLNELIKLKNEVLKKRATPPMWLKCDLKTYDLSSLGKFDVILIDPPLPEYYRRAKSFGVDLAPFQPWTFDEIQNLRVDLIADNCCFLFLWVGSGEGLDKGRELLKNWNFRRCEDIVWIKTNKKNFTKMSSSDSDNGEDNLLQHTKEHCLVGIKGAIKRGIDSHFIHANIDTDVIVYEEPPQGSTEKPVELYRIIERFCMGRKRIELFGEDRNKRPGWLTLGLSLSNSNFNLEKYNNYFKGEYCYPDVQGYEGGRYVGCSVEIEGLRPRSPPRQNVNVNPLGFTPVNSGLSNFNLTNQSSNGNISIPNIPIGNNLIGQNDFNLNRIGLVNKINDVNITNPINPGLPVNPLINVNPILPMNYPFVNQISKIPNMPNVPINNITNIGNLPLNNINNNNSNNNNNMGRTNF